MAKPGATQKVPLKRFSRLAVLGIVFLLLIVAAGLTTYCRSTAQIGSSLRSLPTFALKEKEHLYCLNFSAVRSAHGPRKTQWLEARVREFAQFSGTIVYAGFGLFTSLLPHLALEGNPKAEGFSGDWLALDSLCAISNGPNLLTLVVSGSDRLLDLASLNKVLGPRGFHRANVNNVTVFRKHKKFGAEEQATKPKDWSRDFYARVEIVAVDGQQIVIGTTMDHVMPLIERSSTPRASPELSLISALGQFLTTNSDISRLFVTREKVHFEQMVSRLMGPFSSQKQRDAYLARFPGAEPVGLPNYNFLALAEKPGWFGQSILVTLAYQRLNQAEQALDTLRARFGDSGSGLKFPDTRMRGKSLLMAMADRSPPRYLHEQSSSQLQLAIVAFTDARSSAFDPVIDRLYEGFPYPIVIGREPR